MKKIILFLSMTVCLACLPAGYAAAATSEISESQQYYAREINIQLVNNKMRLFEEDGSRVPGTPDHDDPIPEYRGTYEQAHYLIRQYKQNYKSFSMRLSRGLELLTTRLAGYDPSLDSIFISSGLTGTSRDAMGENTIRALAARNILKNYNVFVFDLSSVKWSIFLTVIKGFLGLSTNYEDVAVAMGDFINSASNKGLMSLDRLHFFGFCYSSQLLGYVARYLYRLNNKKIKTILALDPHSIGLSWLRVKHVSAEDAETVHVYHTNSLVIGTLRRIGTADFVFNGGSMQPGCRGKYQCNHFRAVQLAWYVILYPSLFVARECSSWLAFKLNICKTKNTVKLSFPPSQGAAGTYYLNTNSKGPYGYGEKGAKLP